MVLVRHLISQDHAMEWSSDFMGKSPLRQLTILQNMVAIATVLMELK